ncbi:NAD(P)H-hydrate epimerase [Candidatus Woesearchaeota archaeon]|nr:NAD(P)H-hydrate epimerase [Candidatus Woesearchaeota archaeon]
MITVAQLRKLEREAQKQGVFAKDLMDNVGREVAHLLTIHHEVEGKRVIIFAGQGNNGGDGFALARYLLETVPVVVLFFGEKIKLTPEALKEYDAIWQKATIVPIKNKEDLEKIHFQPKHQLILVDAMLGIGIEGDIREPVSWGIDFFNSIPGEKISLDVPSGLHPDTGDVANKICDVDTVFTFHDTKPGLEKYNAKIIVVDIGLGQKG